MNIFSTFYNIAKKETAGKSSFRALIKEMREESVSYRKEKQNDESLPVPEGFTKSQFVSAYKNLQLTTVISTSFLAFMFAYIFTSDGLIGFFSIGAFLVIGIFWHFSFVIRAYRARIIFDNWDKRTKPFVVSNEEIIESALTSPKILFPFLCDLAIQEKTDCANINKKKGLKKGDNHVNKK